MFKTLCRQSLLALIFLLSACFGGGNYAPVVELQGRATVIPRFHMVHRGETLYSIAWRYNIDFRELAATNRIAPPYTIYPGQRLRVRAVTHLSSDALESTSGEVARTATAGSNDAHKTQQNSSISKQSTDTLGLDKKHYPFRWQWPARGRLLSRYRPGSALHKGIDIQGKLGEPVRAANSGKVVYAGSGLVGYGKLLIIKHDDQYLSAYGHNRRLLVSEGDLVKVGQEIAEFGDSGTDRVELHFEIRRDGKPINPLSKLPKG